MDPFVTLTAAAVVTKKLKVATGICLVIQRDTIQTAKLVASIDQVSGGRFLFGIGGGWNAEEIEAHGTVFDTRMKKMREQIEAMKEIWTKPTAEYNGDIVTVPSMQTWPKPTQKPYARRFWSVVPSPGQRGGRSVTVTAGSRMRTAAIRTNICRAFVRWQPKPGGTRNRCR